MDSEVNLKNSKNNHPKITVSIKPISYKCLIIQTKEHKTMWEHSEKLPQAITFYLAQKWQHLLTKWLL